MIKFFKSLKKIYPIHLLLFFIVVLACDQLLKYILSSTLENTQTSSFLGFYLEPFTNSHWIFGFQLGMPILSFVIFSGLFCILIYLYILFIYYFPNLNLLTLSLTLLFAGVTSNLIDRIRNGYVFDFITYKWGSNISFHFNSSDILQTFAWCLLIYIIISNRKIIWPYIEQRKTLLIMKKQQLEFIFYFIITATYVSTFFILLNHQFLNQLQKIELSNQKMLFIKLFLDYSLIVLIALIVPLIGLSLYFSNKVYGPIYAFNKYVKDLLDGKNPKDLKLRKNDTLKKELESLSIDIKNKIK